MAQHDLDADIHKNRLLQEIDAAITEANRVKIKAAAGAITQDQMLRVAVAVSGLRANYLHEILALGDKGAKLDQSPGTMSKLKDLRIAYEEGVAAFDHLRHALDRGYIDFDEG
ncbi:MAG: hypothetical protein HOB82_03570 [Alphaproteobacteria bacterium]|jgi:hypothetical protein|nr:hypothetical protein [Alphaproteobacteria bacterium]MBT4710589.1 hypothetical protein [Alphaproteobacteria bacterium]MBT5860415.1 hypothetical protein [Alphaproteobacteria bacterium]